METLQDVLKALRTIKDDEILASDPEELEGRAYRALSGMGFDGLVLRMPARVSIRQLEKLTSIIAVEQSREHARRIPLGKNAVAIITKTSGGCWLAPTFVDPPNKNPPLDPPPPPPENSLMSDMRLMGVKIADLRPEDFPWDPGRLVVRIVSEDWSSNAEIVTLEDPKAATPPPRKIKIGPGNYSKGADHPALKGPGMALALSGGTARGSLRLKKDPEWPVTEDGKPAIPVVIALKQPGVLFPVLIQFHVPGTVGEESESWFTIDLSAAAGKYSVYAIAGEHMNGPHPWESR